MTLVIPYEDDQIMVCQGDMIEVLSKLPAESFDSIVTDPPYAISFMQAKWDTHSTPQIFQQWCEVWATECLRVLKPGGHALIFGGTRTYHRLACAVEDAGFEIRDSISWLYGSGFPKSLDVSKAIDKAAGAEREVIGPNTRHHGGGTNNVYAQDEWTKENFAQKTMLTAPATDAAKQWAGWGTALKPAFEPVVVARKPIQGTVAANVLAHGTGALNIDACRIGTGEDSQGARSSDEPSSTRHYTDAGAVNLAATPGPRGGSSAGRWPSNVVLDGAMAAVLDADTAHLKQGGAIAKGSKGAGPVSREIFGQDTRDRGEWQPYQDSGGASRYFPVFRYQAKAPTKERPSYTKEDDTKVSHPTCKPLELMKWLVRLVTPPDGTVLDPFAGSGTTGEAALAEGVNCMLIEREADYIPLILVRIDRSNLKEAQ